MPFCACVCPYAYVLVKTRLITAVCFLFLLNNYFIGSYKEIKKRLLSVERFTLYPNSLSIQSQSNTPWLNYS